MNKELQELERARVGYLAGLVDVTAAEIRELLAKGDALRLSLDTRSATVPRAAYEAQRKECITKTGVIKILVGQNKRLRNKNEIQRLAIKELRHWRGGL
jgi:hypothetical protein